MLQYLGGLDSWYIPKKQSYRDLASQVEAAHQM